MDALINAPSTKNLSALLLEYPFFKIISQCSTQLKIDTYVIGGFVRDLLLQRHSKDVDVVCLGSGIEVANLFFKLSKEQKFPVTEVSIFKRFGTAMVKFNNGFEIDFVGARKESYRLASRNPKVTTGSLQDDFNRRDFSINTLAISLSSNSFGNFIDPFNGLMAINQKQIITPLDPDITFSDDPLRMLRAIRFSTQLNFQIEKNTFSKIIKNKNRITIVSQERITEELNKIILSPSPSIGFKLLEKSGLLAIIFKELDNLKGIEVINGKGHKDNFLHTIEVLDNIAKDTQNLWLRWAAILHDIAKPATKRFDINGGWSFHGHEDKGAKMVKEIFSRLKLPLNHHLKYVRKLVRLHLRPIALVNDTVSDSALRRLLTDAGSEIDDLMLLCNADITSKNELKVTKYKENFKLVIKKLKKIEEKDHLRNFQPPISGQLISSTYNLPPCKLIGDIKGKIKEAILEGLINNNYQQAYNYMLEIGKEMNLTKVN